MFGGSAAVRTSSAELCFIPQRCLGGGFLTPRVTSEPVQTDRKWPSHGSGRSSHASGVPAWTLALLCAGAALFFLC